MTDRPEGFCVGYHCLPSWIEDVNNQNVFRIQDSEYYYNIAIAPLILYMQYIHTYIYIYILYSTAAGLWVWIWVGF